MLQEHQRGSGDGQKTGAKRGCKATSRRGQRSLCALLPARLTNWRTHLVSTAMFLSLEPQRESGDMPQGRAETGAQGDKQTWPALSLCVAADQNDVATSYPSPIISPASKEI